MLNNINLINFTDLTLKEKKMVLFWRNHFSVKKWMHYNDNITFDNHLAFIDSLKNALDKIYFLVKQDDLYIGVIDFTNVDNHLKVSEFGLYANIKLKGMGNILLNSICEYGFNTLQLQRLKAEVYRENGKAVTLYKKFNFKETGTKIINNKEVICMELKNENR